MGVRVQLAGQVGLTVNGRSVDTAGLGRRDLLVLAYLVLERGRRVAQPELADVVWEERVPATWKTALRGSVSRVRAILSGAGLPDALVTGAGWYELRLPTRTVVDVETAGEAIAAAAALLAPGGPANARPTNGSATAVGPADRLARARKLAGEAQEIARLPFLVGVHASWVDHRQEMLDDLRLRCLEVLATGALHSGDWLATREHASGMLRLAPLRESAYRLLALAHAGAGDRGEAAHVLATCRGVLAEELGASPSPETESLHVGLLRGTPLSELLTAPAPSTGKAPPLTGPASPFPGHASPFPGHTSRPAPAGLEELAGVSLPLVGRSGEVGRLLDAWHRAAAGAPELAIVVGEAGVGKSRIVAHLADMVAGFGATVLYGRCDGGVGGEVLAEALHGHLPAFPAEASNQVALAAAVRSTLGRLGARTPVLLVLDDVHVLDWNGLSLVRSVLRGPDPLPLLVVGTFRSGEAESDRRLAAVVAAGRDVRPVTHIDLAGLPAAEVAELVRQLAGDRPDAALLSSIVDATGGNPLFVRELVQLWQARGCTAVKDGVLTLTGAGPDLVPDGVRATILARCRSLAPTTRRVLAVAAVAGREVGLAQLEAVPELSTVDVLAALEEAVGARLMVERAAGRFAFVHGLVSETLRRELSAARRQRLHADLATALEARPGSAAPDLARVAYHLLRGGPGVADRAVAAASRAAAAAQHRHAYAEAAQYYAAALSVPGADPVVACRLRLEQAWALWRAGEIETAQEVFRAAAATAVVAGRPDLAGHAVFGLAGHGPSLGFCNDQLAGDLAAAVDRLPAEDPFRPRLIARLGTELAGVQAAVAIQRCRDALARAEAGGDAATIAYARHCLNWASLGDPSDRDGLARSDAVIEAGVQVSDRHMEIEGRLWRCTYLLRAGRVAEATAEAEILAQVVAALRQPFFVRLPLRVQATLALLRGDYGQAQALADEIYPVERRVHPRDAEIHAVLRDVALAHLRGDWPDLGRRLADLHGPHWTAMRAVWLAANGRIRDAATTLEPVLAGQAAALQGSPLAPFVGALLARAGADEPRLAQRMDVQAVRSLLRPWAGTHAVAGCAVASLGPVDEHLQTLDDLLS